MIMKNNCKCKTCGKEFYQKPSRIKAGKGKYCSRPCWFKAGYSEESKAKMSKSRMGKTPWNKGKPCPEHIKEYFRKLYLGRKTPEETKTKLRISCKGVNRGAKNGMWKGGIKRSGKYIYITLAEGIYIGEHRYLMEKLLGRKLTSNEVVHHINYRRDDNRLENLVVMSKTAHSTFHNLENNKHVSR
jgi:hypothetical protein